jgi:hypothetical protein
MAATASTSADEHHPSTGRPYPEAENGEVYGPSGARCYLPLDAARLAGRSSANWAKKLIRDGAVMGEYEEVGHKRVFVVADGFDRLALEKGWGSERSVAEDRDWQAIAVQQERDLEAAREREKEATNEIDRLTRMVNELTEMLQRRQAGR